MTSAIIRGRKRGRPRPRLCLLVAIAGFACAPATAGEGVLADPATMLQVGERRNMVGANAFSVEATQKGSCLRSAPDRSASALYQALDINATDLRNVRWWWRVDRLQSTADIRKLDTEDFGAAVMLVFGEPSLFHRSVPSLAYVWTATPIENETILPSRRYGSLVHIQLHGRGDVGQWHLESRDVAADYRAIFGQPPGRLRYIAVFNDNDQTGEPASALFCAIVNRNDYLHGLRAP